MIILTREEFLKRTGVDLANEFNDDSISVDEFIETTLTRWSKILYQEVRKVSLRPIPDDNTKLSSLQVDTIKESICNLGLYFKQYGDVKSFGAVDGAGNPIQVVPQNILDDLRSVGLIRRSFGRVSVW